MKKITIAAMALVMITAMLTGCGCMNSAAPTSPTVMPSIAPSSPATRPTESMTTEATTPATEAPASGTDSTEFTGTTDPAATEASQPMTRDSGEVKSHVNGNF